MVPQFANAQGEQKINEQQMQALKLFFNEQNIDNTQGKQQPETLGAQSVDISSQQKVEQQQAQLQAQIDAHNNHKDMAQFSDIQSQPSTTNDNQKGIETSQVQTPNIQKVQNKIEVAKSQQLAQAQQQSQLQAQIDADNKQKKAALQSVQDNSDIRSAMY
jgi:hypothetical protein